MNSGDIKKHESKKLSDGDIIKKNFLTKSKLNVAIMKKSEDTTSKICK